MIDELREGNVFAGAQEAQMQSWHEFDSGYRGVDYGVSFTQSEKARVELSIRAISPEKDWAKWAFDELAKKKDLLESELGVKLVWERLDNRYASRISIARSGSIDDDPETLKEIKKWMIDQLLRFKQVFGPRLPDLVKSQPVESQPLPGT